MVSLEKQRALQKSEKAKETSELWEAILAVNDALTASGHPLPPTHVRRAQSNLMRAGVIGAGDLPDDDLAEIANVGGTRQWAPDMGPVYQNESVALNGVVYVCTNPHIAQSGWEPGSEGGRTLFRVIRREPEEGSAPLEFVWGEHVPYGAVRRDPSNGGYYTPIHEGGVTLYEPHYPHLVPSEYVEVAAPDDGGTLPDTEGQIELNDSPVEPEHPRWADLPDGHDFAVGDRFTDYGKTYEVLRVFAKQSSWRPPALNDDFYKIV
jgi:hypothetical protein